MTNTITRAAMMLGVLLVVGASLACSSDAPGIFPYEPDTTEVIGPDGTKVVTTPGGGECIDIEQSGECVKPQETCGEGAFADVIVDEDGRVLDVVCHPTDPGTIVIKPGEPGGTVPDNTTIVDVERGGDGPDFTGDISVDGNKTTLFGDSPDVTVIAGNVTLRGNESVVRGIRIQGDLTFDGNQSKAYYCVVEGNVIFKGNSNLLAGCIVFGEIQSSGNSDRVLANYVQGEIRVKNAAECDKNRGFKDGDSDLVLDISERDASAPLACQ